jgi:hypothetical protein
MIEAWLPAAKTEEKIPKIVPGRLVPSKIASIIATAASHRGRIPVSESNIRRI